MRSDVPDVDGFRFRGVHPRVRLGTASDRYAGWIGQIYAPGRYDHVISRRTKEVGGASFVEAVLPVESVAEYFDHFQILEIDYTFYRPLLEADGRPTGNHRLLGQYARQLGEGDRLFLKVPQAVTARRVRRGGSLVPNAGYLDPRAFTEQFYRPATSLLGSALGGLIFEQAYDRKQERLPIHELAQSLDAFFKAIPAETRYHLELRTEAYLAEPIFEVMARHGVGQVLSHWTWLPPLRRQLAGAGGRFFNAGRECVVRLMTPPGMRYEEAYAKAHPFDRLVDGMLHPRMLDDALGTAREALAQGVGVNIIVNNRAGGNAPLMAQQLARRFLEML